MVPESQPPADCTVREDDVPMILLMLACSGPASEDGTVDSPTAGDTSPTADSGGGSLPWIPDARAVFVDDVATVVAAGPGEYGFGTLLATGGDLDKDGRLEWSTCAPTETIEAIVRTYEGTEPLTERNPFDYRFALNYPKAMAHADLDGDGFSDLVFAFNHGNDARLQAVTSVDPVDDSFFAIDIGAPVTDTTGIVTSIHAATDQTLTIAYYEKGMGVWRGTLPSGPGQGAPDLPVALDRSSHEMLWISRVYQTDPVLGLDVREPMAITHPNDPTHPTVWFGTEHANYEEYFGRVLHCPDGLGLDVDADCTVVAIDTFVGMRQTAIDLDGDGWVEVISSGETYRDVHGEVHVFDHDGTERATITCTRTAQLGARMHAATDAQGNAWLLLGQYNMNGTDPSIVYAFRGTDVHGELTEDDAETVYYLDLRSRFEAIDVYRETADGPPVLLLGHPTAGAVYMLPFEPGTDSTPSAP